MRNFDTGATRDSDTNKFDYEGFFSPMVMEAFARYMHTHRVQADGSVRDSDNWQKGIPKSAYMKSAWRHFMDVWKEHRGIKTEYGLVESLCALMFNIMGYLHETLKEQTMVEIVALPTEEKDVYVEVSPRKLQNDWDKLQEETLHYTHRYGALAHDQTAIEDEDREETSRHKSPLPPQGYGKEALLTDNAAVPSLSGVEHRKVLGICPQWSTSEVESVAAEIRRRGFAQATIREDGAFWFTGQQPPKV